MEASGTSPASDTPRQPSYLERLRGFALGVEERINPSEIQDILSAVVNLLDHQGVEIPEPVQSDTPATVEELEAENARLRAELAGGQVPQPAAPVGTPATEPVAPTPGPAESPAPGTGAEPTAPAPGYTTNPTAPGV